MAIRNNIGFKKKFCKSKYINPKSGLISGVATVTGTLSGRGNLEGISNGVAFVSGSSFSSIKALSNGQATLIGELTGQGILSGESNGSSLLNPGINGNVDYNVKISGISNGTSFVVGTLLSTEKEIKGCLYEVIYVDKKYVVKYCC